MIGNLLETARADAAKIASAGGFQVSAVLSTPDNSISLPVTGLATGTWMVFDDLRQGKPVNSRSNSFDIPITQLIAGNYPGVVNGRCNLVGHKITVTDGGGMAGNFVITEQHPNTTLGLAVCLLGKA